MRCLQEQFESRCADVRVSRRIIAFSVSLLAVASALLPAFAAAESGIFTCTDTNCPIRVWHSDTPMRVRVTITVSNPGNLYYCDYSQPSVHFCIEGGLTTTLHYNETATVESSYATFVEIWESTGLDHNYHEFGGLGGHWEVVVLGAAGDSGGGADGGDGGLSLTTMLAVGVVAVVIAAVVFDVVKYLRKTGRVRGKVQTPTTPPNGFAPAAQRNDAPQGPWSSVSCPNCRTLSPQGMAFCSNCGSPLR